MKSLVLFSAIAWFSSVASAMQIPLTKCCSESDEVYDLGMNRCVELADSNQTRPWPPLIHSFKSNRRANFTLSDLNSEQNLTQCPDGFIAQSSSNFTLYEDGSLKVVNDQSKFSPGSFCVDNIQHHKMLDPSIQFAARFCVRDPCLDRTCVSKCCPDGFVIDVDAKKCIASADRYRIDFRNKSGSSVSVPEDSYAIRYGIFPSCQHGIVLLNPDVQVDQFYVLPSGQLYIPHSDFTVTTYCVDEFHNVTSQSTKRQALFCASPPPEVHTAELLIFKIFPYFLFVSAAFLLATFVIYAVIAELRNIAGLNIMCYSASLATTFICLGALQLDNHVESASCKAIGILVHFCFLSAFTWLSVMSFDIWYTLSDLGPKKFSTRHRGFQVGRRFLFYSLYAWGVPTVIVVIGQIVESLPIDVVNVLRPGIGVERCWLSGKSSIFAYFYGPVAAILLANTVFFVLSTMRICQARRDASFAAQNQTKQRNFYTILSLFVLMGLLWITEIISWSVENATYYFIPTDIINIISGIFVFYVFVCKKKVRHLIVKKIEQGRSTVRQTTMSTDLTSPSTIGLSSSRKPA